MGGRGGLDCRLDGGDIGASHEPADELRVAFSGDVTGDARVFYEHAAQLVVEGNQLELVGTKRGELHAELTQTARFALARRFALGGID